MVNLRVKIPYILLQGIFLPLLWLLDKYYESGDVVMAWVIFGVYEFLTLGDAILYWVIFDRKR